MIYIGTSGFSYKEWKGIFYPEDLGIKQFLSYYAKHFPTTEINNTFYRIPSLKVTSGWLEQVPNDFRFTLKLSRRITHQKKLEDVEEPMGWFEKGSAPLADQLASVLVQLPPWFRQKLDVLRGFLEGYAAALPLAFEFRHDSWFNAATYDVMALHSATLVAVETDEKEAVCEDTGSFRYLRLRKSDYTKQEISKWADWLLSSEGDSFVYFKHQNQAPLWAEKLKSAVRER